MKKYFFMIMALTIVIVSSFIVDPSKAQSNLETFPNLSMPKEYINYTITKKNGIYWAKVQGKYPITILNNLKNPQINLPLIYPTPPDTKNIQIKFNGKKLSWINYSVLYPDLLHHTAIGDWSMIYCLIENVSDSFILEIQYEHPVQKEKEKLVFLYDLNISPYLSIQSPSSTAYFTINFESKITDIHLFTTKTDTEWITTDYLIRDINSKQIVSCQIKSEYLEPLQGDLVITFKDPIPQTTFNSFYLGSVSITIILGITIFGFFHKKIRRSRDER